ncbi:hypothetical protein COV12_02775 [Candidatus Woesearchaeota archaeon CG10_big_fil_rev_8_21_14_0_10_32_24]|nr:MAG: hypothetical protein COV12_02775 [Candidatus Woesearchaeota archaeon CG10_big_fil_rev_8_21_14_0_10_32_24]
MTLATTLIEIDRYNLKKERRLRLVEPQEEKPLIQRIGTNLIQEREINWIKTHIADKIDYKQGICNLREYQRINQCYDIIDCIESLPLRRFYKELGAKTGRIHELSIYNFTYFIYVGKIRNSNEKLTACLMLNGNATLEYNKKGLYVPLDIKKGDLLLWDSFLHVGLDELNEAQILVFGMI